MQKNHFLLLKTFKKYLKCPALVLSVCPVGPGLAYQGGRMNLLSARYAIMTRGGHFGFFFRLYKKKKNIFSFSI